MKPELYLVGGTVRDQLLGRAINDWDFAVEAESYDAMKAYLIEKFNLHIWQERPEFGTIRGQYTHQFQKINADFTICRKDGEYSDQRHPDSIIPTTILDDLSRRDFTINAIAKNFETGVLIDHWDGQVHLSQRLICAVGNAYDRFDEDPLRILRALRFATTYNFQIDKLTQRAMRMCASNLRSLPVERVRTELHKMFKHDSALAMINLRNDPILVDEIFNSFPTLWLKPTTEMR